MKTNFDRPAVWAFRFVWAALIIAVAPAIGEVLASHSRPVQLVGTGLAWVMWTAGLMASLVPTCVSLTVLRLVAALPVAVSLGCAMGGASTNQSIAAITASALAAVLASSPELGAVFVQGSAYGDEQRIALRPPGTLLFGPLPALWAILATASVAGPLLLAARAWLAGGATTIAAVGLGVILGRRFHRLSMRWLVFVPAGVVVHDQLVLAETVMFRIDEITGLGLAPAATEAADLTGNALGSAVELRLRETGTVVLTATADHPGGRALHVRSLLVSPTRPGRAIEAARRRNLPA